LLHDFLGTVVAETRRIRSQETMPEPAHSPHDASGLPPAHDRTPEARERLQGQLRAS